MSEQLDLWIDRSRGRIASVILLPQPDPPFVEIPIGEHRCLIDEADLPLIKDKTLAISQDGYVMVRWGGCFGYLHRMVLATPPGMLADHINGDRADDRRINLRIATKAQNACNGSRRKHSLGAFKGVNLDKRSRLFRVSIKHNGVKHSLGCFEDEREAARAYDAAAVKLHGDFARLNFPGDSPIIPAGRVFVGSIKLPNGIQVSLSAERDGDGIELVAYSQEAL